MQVDKTFIGKRKYDRETRQRETGYWFATDTEQEGRMMGLTHCKLVKTRDRATLQAWILSHLASARTVVVSDAGRLILTSVSSADLVHHTLIGAERSR